jgi:hypothetical protein
MHPAANFVSGLYEESIGFLLRPARFDVPLSVLIEIAKCAFEPLPSSSTLRVCRPLCCGYSDSQAADLSEVPTPAQAGRLYERAPAYRPITLRIACLRRSGQTFDCLLLSNHDAGATRELLSQLHRKPAGITLGSFQRAFRAALRDDRQQIGATNLADRYI